MSSSQHGSSYSGSLSVGAVVPWQSATSAAELEEATPEASEQALQYLQSVVHEVNFRKLMFEDDLVTVSDTGKELGIFKITIEASKLHGQPCFLVHANSDGVVDGVPCGTSIVCHVSKSLETLEQHHHEFVKLEYGPLDRKTHIVKQPDGYLVNKIIARGDDVKPTTRVVPLDTMKGFISEGSNMLLHRILIVKGLPYDLQFISFDSEDNICPTVYRPLVQRTQTVDEIELKVFGVERCIDSKVDLPTYWQSYYSRDGHLANRVQIGSPVTMTLQHLPTKDFKDDMPAKPVFSKKSLDWEEDIEMFSRFLDRKEELKNSHLVFLRHHPELKALLADFLQFLLLQKPVDVLAFSAEYFAAFSATITSGPRYIASADPPLFPHVRTNAEIESLRAVRVPKD